MMKLPDNDELEKPFAGFRRVYQKIKGTIQGVVVN